MTTAFQTWMAADCGNGQHPGLRVSHRGPVECTDHEYNAETGNANVVVFHAGAWPYGDGGGKLGLTSLSFSSRDATVYDADIEINWSEVRNMERPPIALHEAGHFLGLAHSDDPLSVMNAEVHGGAASTRELSADDVSAICAIYPPIAGTLACDATPRNGFRSACRTSPASEPAKARGHFPVVIALGLVTLAASLVWLQRRRRA